ncbi:YitT family protein [Oceanobacillus halotolerans]|uniref:YitT family protein n=1 Tax=Oceanobacillus halotolerans TaxID=2663380 RepID=UPI0013D8E621|nr:YitT family protein [Oceanobacillus halotolerans]
MIKRFFAILFGSTFIAIGVNYFVVPHHLVDGGIIGLGLISKYAFDLKPGFMIILLSIPLYFIAFLRFRTYFYNALHGLLVSSFFIDLFHPIAAWNTSTPILISSLSGGLFIGIGVSTLLLTGTSTSGTDLLALMISTSRSVNVGIITMIIDASVILLGWFIIHETTILYSGLMVTMNSLTIYTVNRYFD